MLHRYCRHNTYCHTDERFFKCFQAKIHHVYFLACCCGVYWSLIWILTSLLLRDILVPSLGSHKRVVVRHIGSKFGGLKSMLLWDILAPSFGFYKRVTWLSCSQGDVI